jgi:hypothetical protein
LPDASTFCSPVAIEFAIIPHHLVNVDGACALPSEFLPPIAPRLSAPYAFGFNSDGRPLTTTYNALYANHQADETDFVVVATYNIEVGTQAFLSAAVASDFLLHHVQVRIRKNDRLIYGVDRFNLNHVEQVLATGTYELQLVIPNVHRQQQARTALPTPTCAPLNMWMRLSDYHAQSDRCQLDGEPLPITLNGLRFLGADGSKHIHYRSNQYRAARPDAMQRQWSHFVALETAPDEDLVLRVSTIAWSGMSMRIELVRVTSDPQGGLVLAPVATGYRDQGQSLSFVTRLASPGIYRIVLFFSVEPSQLTSACPTFAMEIAAEPPVPLAHECPNHATSHWNPRIDLANPFTTPYHYNSRNVDGNHTSEALYVQQRVGGTRNHYNILQLTRPANMRVELAYQFLTGDMCVSLQVIRRDSSTWYHGVKMYNKWYERVSE